MIRNQRIFGLDLLRSLAIMFVVYGHGYFLIAGKIPEYIYLLPAFDGVSIFFVLSGFLIGRILIRTVLKTGFNEWMLLEFWIRRWFRTLPNYLLILIFLILVNSNIEQQYIIRYFSFTQNIASPHPVFFPEAWSLAVEEWFYILIPIPLYISAKLNFDRRKIILYGIFFVIIFSTIFRFYRAHYFGYYELSTWDISIRKQVITRLDSLMFGVLGAYISMYHKNLWDKTAPNPALIVGIGLLLFDKLTKSLFSHTWYMLYLNYFTLTVTAIGTLFLLPKLSALKIRDSFLASMITFVSISSYSMYLLHLSPVQFVLLPQAMSIIMHYLWRYEEYRIFISYLLYWVITILSSWLMYRFYEKPMTNLRDKWPTNGHSIIKAFPNFSSKSGFKLPWTRKIDNS